MAQESTAGRSSLPRLVLFARSINQPAIIESLHRSLSTTRDLEYKVTGRADELTEYVAMGERTVILANCLLKEDIADLYNALPMFEGRVSDGTLRILVLNSIRHPRLGPLLRSRVALEILEIPISLKALQYKMKNALTSVHQAWQKGAGAKKGMDLAADTKPAQERTGKKKSSTEVVWQSGYDHNYDVWWIPGARNIRNVVGAWLIDMLGPGPIVGTWEEMPGIERNGERGWVWRPRSVAEEIFQTPGGRWIFFGKQPEFSWQKNLWSFVSKAPLLAYYREDSKDPEYTRFEFKSGEGLNFLENSAHTKALLPRIQATFETRLGFGNAEKQEEAPPSEGPLDGWGFDQNEPDSGGPKNISKGGAGSEGSAGWNNHSGSVGVDFGAKNIQIQKDKSGVKPWRNALSPDEKLGKQLGLTPVENPGVNVGGKAFDKIQMVAEVIRKNGENIGPVKDLFLYDINESGAVLLLPRALGAVSDRFHIRLRLDTGSTKLECVMVWELTAVDMELGGNSLTTGAFRSGDFDPLFSLLDQLDTRKKELAAFFKTARG